MQPLPAQALPVVPHMSFSVFHLAIPNVMAWVLVLVIVVVAARIRLPRFFEPDW